MVSAREVLAVQNCWWFLLLLHRPGLLVRFNCGHTLMGGVGATQNHHAFVVYVLVISVLCFLFCCRNDIWTRLNN